MSRTASRGVRAPPRLFIVLLDEPAHQLLKIVPIAWLSRPLFSTNRRH